MGNQSVECGDWERPLPPSGPRRAWRRPPRNPRCPPPTAPRGTRRRVVATTPRFVQARPAQAPRFPRRAWLGVPRVGLPLRHRRRHLRVGQRRCFRSRRLVRHHQCQRNPPPRFAKRKAGTVRTPAAVWRTAKRKEARRRFRHARLFRDPVRRF